MGHGFGGLTAMIYASKDPRIKYVVSYDPWLVPILDEIRNGEFILRQPHCSVSSEMFMGNEPDNWKELNRLYIQMKGNNKKRDLLALLNGVGHMAFTDLSLLLLLEFRLITFTPSFSQVFRG